MITKKQRVLSLLKKSGKRGVDYLELAKITPRYGSVIATLRDERHDIVTVANKPGPGARYRLTR